MRRLGLADVVSHFLSVPNKSACVQHMATRNANSAAPASHIVGVTECGSTVYESIEVRRINIGVTMSTNRLIALIIRENKEDVRFVGESARNKRSHEGNQSR